MGTKVLQTLEKTMKPMRKFLPSIGKPLITLLMNDLSKTIESRTLPEMSTIIIKSAMVELQLPDASKESTFSDFFIL
uniref:Uncharacterized protein n=1 Tax=Romanomermis culicivorax TaxID=13658 RepID=A0A915IC83_ROMCU